MVGTMLFHLGRGYTFGQGWLWRAQSDDKSVTIPGRTYKSTVLDELRAYGDAVERHEARPTILAKAWMEFVGYQIDKFEFFDATMNYTPKTIADYTGLDIDVIRDRRRYLRQLAKQH
jgi:hypothetical protein